MIIQHDHVIMQKLVVFSLCCVLFTSCVSPSFKRGEKPRDEDLLGVYIPTSATIRRLKKEGYHLKKEISIELQEGGMFMIKNMPDLWMTDWAESQGGFDSGYGVWEVDKSYSVWVILISFDTMDEQSTNNLLNIYTIKINIIHSRPPYGLAIALMAGDDGYLWFEKAIQRP